MMHRYKVDFDIYRNKTTTSLRFCCTAKNAKEARVIAEQAWYICHKPHMFHITAKRLAEGDEYKEAFKVISNYVWRKDVGV